MLRALYNFCKGRKLENHYSIDDIFHLWEMLEHAGDIRGSLIFDEGHKHYRKDATLKDIGEELKDDIRNEKGYHIDAFHEIYSGKNEEQHYIDISKNRVIHQMGYHGSITSLHTTATIEYMIKK